MIALDEVLLTLVIVVFCIIIVFFVGFTSWQDRDQQSLETVTGFNRGTRAERYLVLKLLKVGISAQEIFHDLYIKKFNGTFSQIDLVVITDVGIIVFEVKDYSGWIFGNGNHRQWTQVLAYGKQKYRFYNPVMQNNNHIIELRKKIRNFAKVPFYSIIVFYGDCEMKDISFIPKGTFITKSVRVLDVIEHIIKNNEIVNYAHKDKVIEVLKESVKNGENIETQIQHIENIRNMMGEDRVFK